MRRPFGELDQQMINWAVSRGVPAHAVLTKADKLSRNQQKQALMKTQKALPEGCALNCLVR